MRVGALFSAQWRQENRLKLRVGGEISLTLREGQTERGGQVGLKKCVSTSLACALIRARPSRGDCRAPGGGGGGGSPSETSGNRKTHHDLRVPRYFHSPPPRTRRARSVFVSAVEMLSTLRGQRPRSPVPPPMALHEVLCGKWSSPTPELPAVFRGDDAMSDARRCLKRSSNFSRDAFKTNTARQWGRHFG